MPKRKARKKLTPSEKLNLLIRTAALTVNEHGRIEVLASHAGLEGAAIRAAIRRGYLSPHQAYALEKAFPKILPVSITTNLN